MDVPLFSLLVATVGRKNELSRLLESLACQDLSTDNFEVLIADQNPEGFLETVLAPFSSRLRLQVISIPNNGVSQARNALLPLAQGKYIAFPDDDCYYAASTLQRALNGFKSFKHVRGILLEWLSTPAQKKENVCSDISTVNWFTAFNRGETYVQFYHREVVQAIGHFDPKLGPGTGLPYGCGEDTDYLLRAIKAGFTVLRIPGACVFHKEVNSLQDTDPKKIRSYAMGRMYLLHKHRLPLWFHIFNILFPLFRMPFEGRRAVSYRWKMFLARWQSFRGYYYKKSSSG